MGSITRRLILASFLVCVSNSVFATLIGDTVNLNLQYDQDSLGPGGTEFSGSAVVGAGVEFTVPVCSDCPGGAGGSPEGTFLIDLGAQSITLSQTGSSFPDVLLFDLLLTDIDVQITGFTAVEGNAFTVSFTDHSFSIRNLENFNPPSNFTNVYTLQLAPAPAPEPGIIALLSVALAGLGFARRRTLQ